MSPEGPDLLADNAFRLRSDSRGAFGRLDACSAVATSPSKGVGHRRDAVAVAMGQSGGVDPLQRDAALRNSTERVAVRNIRELRSQPVTSRR